MALQKDEITVNIAGVTMKLARLSTLPVPHEVTVVIPRVELRRWRYRDGQLIEAAEKIFNSITIAHSPRHEPERTRTPVNNSRTTWKFVSGK